MIFTRKLDSNCEGCPLFKTNACSERKFVICIVTLDKKRRLGSGYWKLNMSFPVHKAYTDPVSNLPKDKLPGRVINSRKKLE